MNFPSDQADNDASDRKQMLIMAGVVALSGIVSVAYLAPSEAGAAAHEAKISKAQDDLDERKAKAAAEAERLRKEAEAKKQAELEAARKAEEAKKEAERLEAEAAAEAEAEANKKKRKRRGRKGRKNRRKR